MIYIEEILKILPHRFPFLLIDRVINITKGHSLRAIKNISINDPFLYMHFPQHPILPGVLILESLAQASWILAIKSVEPKIQSEDYFYYLVGIDQVSFKRMVFPGDQMILEIELVKKRQGLTFFKCFAKIQHQLVCTALIKCFLKKKKIPLIPSMTDK
ncbi:MAG: 3-hydroxyacyl-ACP dehydratase FabZ [Candidatus Dasytiphilus stammeri]